MKLGKKLLILPAVAVLLGMGTGCSGDSGNNAYSGGYPFSISGDIRSVPS